MLTMSDMIHERVKLELLNAQPGFSKELGKIDMLFSPPKCAVKTFCSVCSLGNATTSHIS